jgi:hypothetical protein
MICFFKTVFKNIFYGIESNKHYWESYRDNWRKCEVGDYIITENLETTGAIVSGIIEKGEYRKWKILEVTEDMLVAKCNNQRMVFCDDFVGEDDIQHIKGGFGRAKMKLKHYVFLRKGKSFFSITKKTKN